MWRRLLSRVQMSRSSLHMARLGVSLTVVAGTVAQTGQTQAADPTLEESGWQEVDFSKWPLHHHLLHSSLNGPGMVEEYRIFMSPDRQRIRAELRLGHNVCGHPTIVHGGALASAFDDVFGTLFVASKQGNGFTANLSINYRKPVLAGTNLTIEARIERVETGHTGSRKVYFSGMLRDRDTPSILYTEASALFVVKTVPSSDALNKHIAMAMAIDVSSPSIGLS